MDTCYLTEWINQHFGSSKYFLRQMSLVIQNCLIPGFHESCGDKRDSLMWICWFLNERLQTVEWINSSLV